MNFEERLIAAIRKHPCLFNKHSVSYRRRAIKLKAWFKVAVDVGSDVKECQHRWRSLRDRYVREVRSKSNCKWRYMTELTFLKPHLDSSKKNFKAESTLMTDEESCSNSEAYSFRAKDEKKHHCSDQEEEAAEEEEELIEPKMPLPKLEVQTKIKVEDIEEIVIDDDDDYVPDEMAFTCFPPGANSTEVSLRSDVKKIRVDEENNIPVQIPFVSIPHPGCNSTELSLRSEVKKTRLDSAESIERFGTVSEEKLNLETANPVKSRNEDYYKTLDSYMLQLPLRVQDDLKIEILNRVYCAVKKL